MIPFEIVWECGEVLRRLRQPDPPLLRARLLRVLRGLQMVAAVSRHSLARQVGFLYIINWIRTCLVRGRYGALEIQESLHVFSIMATAPWFVIRGWPWVRHENKEGGGGYRGGFVDLGVRRFMNLYNIFIHILYFASQDKTASALIINK